MRILRYFVLSTTLILSSLLFAADEQLASVNINTADSVVLATVLKGVGTRKAEAIIAYRENYGPFQSVDELTSVKGIGQSLLDKNRSSILLE